jgi:hypothetical protein
VELTQAKYSESHVCFGLTAAFRIAERTLNLWLIECRLLPLINYQFALAEKVCSPPLFSIDANGPL